MEIKQNKAVIQAQGYIISEQTLLEKKIWFSYLQSLFSNASSDNFLSILVVIL